MKIKDNIFISVIMPYYNSEKYISESINSILKQTYRNFEFILLDDGSTDQSRNIVNSFTDPRIIKFVNETNIGHPKSMNKLIDLAKGEYIAIMDSDDISEIDRLKVQLNYMIDKNLDVCGSTALMFGNMQNKIIPILENHEDISFMMIFGNPIINPSTMSKASVFKKFKWNENYISADFDVYSRIIQNNFKLGNVKKPLIFSRVHKNQDSSLNFSKGINDSYLISLSHYQFYNIKKINKFYFEKIKFGYKTCIQVNEYIRSMLLIIMLIKEKNLNFQILNQINISFIQKVKLSLNEFFFLIYFFKKNKIKVPLRHKCVLFLRSIFKIDYNHKIFFYLKKINDFLLYLIKK